MACEVLIASKNWRKKTLTLSEIIGEELAYGVMDDNYRLEQGKTGTYTVVYSPRRIGRGFEICLREGEVEMLLTFPNSREDIELFYLTVQRVCDLYDVKRFQCDDETVSLADIEHLIQRGVEVTTGALRQAAEQLGSGETRTLTLFGSLNPLCIGEREIERFGEDIDKFGDWLDELQRLDSFYASPRFYRDQNGEVWGCCFVGSDIVTTVALELRKPFGSDESIVIAAWYAYVSHKDSDVPGTRVPYDRFIGYVKELPGTEYYDAEHIVVTLTDEDIDRLAAMA